MSWINQVKQIFVLVALASTMQTSYCMNNEKVKSELLSKRTREDQGDQPVLKKARHSMVKRLELFEKKLAQQDQIIVTTDCLEYFFTAASDKEFDQFLIAGKEALPQNQVREKLAKKWVRNASTRIFSDDLRSILEIIVNACDASIPEELAVGKFGMGFFSVLSLLESVQTGRYTIHIDTNYQTDEGLEGYTMTFNTHDVGTEKEITVQFQGKKLIPTEQQDSQTLRPGTMVSIKPLAGKFSQEVQDRIRHYTYFMKFYEHAHINLQCGNTHTTVNAKQMAQIINSSTKPHILVTLNEREFSVADTGTGIPLHTALLKLLIPSSSTKGVKSLDALREQINLSPVQLPQLVARSAHDPLGNQDSYVQMTVNGVVVINRPMPRLTNAHGTVLDLVIPLRQAVQLTLARDDLEISPNGKSFEEEQLKRIISATVNQVIFNSQQTDSRIIVALYHGLKQWESCSAANHIKGRFSGYLKSELESRLMDNQKIIPVPGNWGYFHEKIINFYQMNDDFTFVLLPEELVNFNFSRLEEHLHEYALGKAQKNEIEFQALGGNLIQGLRVYFVPNDCVPQYEKPIMSMLGLKDSLFVPCAMLKDTPQETYQEIIAHSGQFVLRAPQKLEELKIPAILLSTYVDGIQTHLSNGIPYLQASLYDFVKEMRARPYKQATAKDFSFLPSHVNALDLSNGSPYSIVRQENSASYKIGHKVTFGALEFLQKLSPPQLKPSFVELQIPKTDDGYYYDLFNLKLDQWIDISKNSYCQSLLHGYGFNLYPCLHFDSSLHKESKEFGQATINQALDTLQSKKDARITVTYADIKNRIIQELLFLFGYGLSDNGQLHLILDDIVHTLSDENSEEIAQRFALLLRYYYFINSKIYRTNYGLSDQLFMHIEALGPKGTDPLLAKLNINIPDVEPWISIDNNQEAYQIEYKALHNAYGTVEYFQKNPDFWKYAYKLEKELTPPIAICHKDADPQEIKDLVRKAMAKLIRHIATLQPAINGLNNIYNVMLPLHIIIKSLEHSPPQNAAVVASMIKTFLGCYEYYLTIDNSEFRVQYGNFDRKETAYASTPDVHELALQKLLAHLDGSKELMHKLMVFQNSDIAFQTNGENRKNDLLHQKLFLPSFFSNTPCSLLARLLEESENPALAQQVLKLCASPEELSFVCHLLLHKKNMNFVRTLPHEMLMQQVTFIIEEFIRNRVDFDEIRVSYQDNRGCNLQERLKKCDQKMIVSTVADYLAQISGQEEIFSTYKNAQRPRLRKIIAQTKPWRLSHLMRAHTLGNGLFQDLLDGNLAAVDQKIADVHEPLNIGKITQAIEAGSEKNPIEASIVECLQNSVDAIKDFYKKASTHDQSVEASCTKRNQNLQDITNINYELARVKSNQSEQESMLLSITDHIGMPGLETLLTDLMLPDYSNKSPALGNIGDMGNGTFKLYQDAAMVTIITRSVRNPEQIFALQVTPQRNSDGLVDDLELRCANISTLATYKNFFGTQFKILFRPEVQEKNAFKLFATRNFLLNCCGATCATVDHGDEKKLINIVFTTRQGSSIINKPGEMIFGAPDCFTAHRRTSLLQSFVTTNGVPFRPFADVNKQRTMVPANLGALIYEGVVIDLPIGSYEPVQSRTQLKMNDGVGQEFAQFCQEIIFQEGLMRAAHDEQVLDLYFTHYKSSAIYSQVLPKKDAIAELHKLLQEKASNILYSKFFMHYQSLDNDTPQVAWLLFKIHEELIEPYEKQQKVVVNFLLNDLVHQMGVDKLYTDEDKLAFRAQWTEAAEQKLSKLTQQFTIQSQNYMHDLLESSHHQFDKLIRTIAFEWIEKKRTSVIKKINDLIDDLLKQYPTLQTEQEKKDEEKLAGSLPDKFYLGMNVKTMLNLMLHNYCDLMIPGIPGQFVAMNNNVIGEWDGTSNDINLTYLTPSMLIKLAHKLYQGKLDEIPEDPAYLKLFAPSLGSAPTVVHELEHAARHSLHTQGGAHDDGVDINGCSTTFDACAQVRARQAVQNGLLAKWSTQIRSQVTEIRKKNYYTGDISNEYWGYVIEKLERLEKENPGKEYQLAKAIIDQK